MSDWLSSTWEANWRSFQYFNLYRLILAGLFFLAIVFPHDWLLRQDLLGPSSLLGLCSAYLIAVLAGLLLSTFWQRRFNIQLSTQVVIDALVVSLFMFASGGVGSGFGVLMMVSLAAASLVGRGRLVLFYAAVATLGALLTQIYGVVGGQFDTATLVQAGVLSSGFFATAILARLLGQRIMLNEELARQRGVELENQGLISQRIVERMQDGILVVSRSGQVMRQNPVATMMLDLPACEFCLLADRAPPLAAALNAWALAGGEDHCELSAPGGQELRARFERTQSSDGEILIFLQDLGQVRAQAQQLKLASLGRLTASIAHEVRNPLSAIGHAGELLREERRGEMQDRLLRILNDNVSRLDRIVSDILELGRQGQANPEPLALGEFCAGFIDHLLATESVQPGVLVLEADAACVLMFDRAHLHQIMWNLVGNALRHASGHVGAVRVRVQPSALEGRVELHLIDDGPGIPANLREQVFEPFFTTHTKGTGLGLFIARELCGANGATLELGPEGGGGHFIVVGRSET